MAAGDVRPSRRVTSRHLHRTAKLALAPINVAMPMERMEMLDGAGRLRDASARADALPRLLERG